MLQPETGRKKIPRRRWAIALLLGFGVLVNYFDRVNLSVSRDALEASFGISAVMFGWLSGAYKLDVHVAPTALRAAAGSIWRARVGIISTVIWSVASFATAIAAGIGGLFGARFLLGIRRGADIPGQFESHRLLVPAKRTQPGHRHV